MVYISVYKMLKLHLKINENYCLFFIFISYQLPLFIFQIILFFFISVVLTLYHYFIIILFAVSHQLLNDFSTLSLLMFSF